MLLEVGKVFHVALLLRSKLRNGQAWRLFIRASWYTRNYKNNLQDSTI